MGCAYLGASHADLRARVDVHTAVGLAGDGAAHGVGDAHGQGSPLLAVPKAHQSVCCFPWSTGKHREAHTGNKWNTGEHRDGCSVPLQEGNAQTSQPEPQGLCSLQATEAAAAPAH